MDKIYIVYYRETWLNAPPFLDRAFFDYEKMLQYENAQNKLEQDKEFRRDRTIYFHEEVGLVR